ncbi:hypothetical protein BDN71DRAFT_211410 [Pleurotus eryngii]|uniref:Uncharacterized protein n=1 Tax=Pleurotus eryngii TaxID=5323 RepID=A0A9P6D2P7_PLEER|nr:hypothetical protein BDN71DRAFT_211410 [Pleurotus eryngii]
MHQVASRYFTHFPPQNQLRPKQSVNRARNARPRPRNLAQFKVCACISRIEACCGRRVPGIVPGMVSAGGVGQQNIDYSEEIQSCWLVGRTDVRAGETRCQIRGLHSHHFFGSNFSPVNDALFSKPHRTRKRGVSTPRTETGYQALTDSYIFNTSYL